LAELLISFRDIIFPDEDSTVYVACYQSRLRYCRPTIAVAYLQRKPLTSTALPQSKKRDGARRGAII